MQQTRQTYSKLIRGKGLEIGALNCPYPVSNEAQVVYSDILTPEQVDQHYPGSKHPDIVSDSESFPTISDSHFDFVIANHVLEHVTDPIGALAEWHRILTPGGSLLMAVPDKRFTFDKSRKRTSLAHLIEDHESPLEPQYRNLVHLHEWAVHVEKLPRGSERFQEWIELQKKSGYSVHNHVWVMSDIFELLAHLWRVHDVKYTVVRCNNTSPKEIEFIYLLKAIKGDASAGALRSDWVRLQLWRKWCAAQQPLPELYDSCRNLLKPRLASVRRYFRPKT